MELSEQLKDAAAVAEEVKELNEYWEGWMYRVRDFKLETMTRSKDELTAAAAGAGDDGSTSPMPTGSMNPESGEMPLQLNDSDLKLLDETLKQAPPDSAGSESESMTEDTGEAESGEDGNQKNDQ